MNEKPEGPSDISLEIIVFKYKNKNDSEPNVGSALQKENRKSRQLMSERRRGARRTRVKGECTGHVVIRLTAQHIDDVRTMDIEINAVRVP